MQKNPTNAVPTHNFVIWPDAPFYDAFCIVLMSKSFCTRSLNSFHAFAPFNGR